MIEIRSCAGFDELEACVQLQIETWGYDASDVIPRKAFLVAQKIGGQVIGAFDSEIAGAPQRAGRNRWWVCLFFAGSEDPSKASRRLICTRTCWRCGRGTGIAGWARNSSWNNGVRRFRAEFGTWNGPSIRWKSRTLFSISTGWERCFAATGWISMVYPHLDCRVGCPRTGSWRSGGWIRRGLRQFSKAARQPTYEHRGTNSGSGLHLRMEGLRSRPGTSPRRSVGESPEVSRGIFPGFGRTWLRPGCGRKWSLRTGAPTSGRS